MKNKFKEEDWVRVRDNKSQEWISMQFKYSTPWKYVEPWTRKVGEWCWFWDGNNNPVLSKFVSYKKSLGYLSQGDWYQEETTCWEHCEPFVGKLPNYLKPSLAQEEAFEL